jgi:hypothetical protein
VVVVVVREVGRGVMGWWLLGRFLLPTSKIGSSISTAAHRELQGLEQQLVG